MELRRTLLKAMLWFLALSAVAGVAAILLADRFHMWRMTAMGFTAAAGAGLMIPTSLLVDRAKARAAGLLGMGAIIVEFTLAMALIWADVTIGFRFEEELAVTMLLLAAASVPGMVFLRVMNWEGGQLAGRVGLALCGADFVVSLLALWLPTSALPPDKWRLWDTAGSVAWLGGLGVLSLIGVGGGDRRHWRWLGAMAAGVALAMALIHIWVGSAGGEPLWVGIVGLAAVVTLANLVWFLRLTDGQAWVRYGTVAAAAIAAAAVDGAVTWDKYWRDTAGIEFLERVIWAAGVVASCGTLAMLVLARLNRRVDHEPGSGPLLDMTIVCPRCHKKQTIPIGDARCAACDLRIHTRIEEPGCPKCGYSLYKLTSDRCPECGTLIRAPKEPAERASAR